MTDIIHRLISMASGCGLPNPEAYAKETYDLAVEQARRDGRMEGLNEAVGFLREIARRGSTLKGKAERTYIDAISRTADSIAALRGEDET